MENYSTSNTYSKITRKLGLIGTLFLFIAALVPVWNQLTGYGTYSDGIINNYFYITLESLSIVIASCLLASALYIAQKNRCPICLLRATLYTFLVCFYICCITFNVKLENGAEPSNNFTIDGINYYVLFAFNYLALAVTASLFGTKIAHALRRN